MSSMTGEYRFSSGGQSLCEDLSKCGVGTKNKLMVAGKQVLKTRNLLALQEMSNSHGRWALCLLAKGR